MPEGRESQEDFRELKVFGARLLFTVIGVADGVGTRWSLRSLPA